MTYFEKYTGSGNYGSNPPHSPTDMSFNGGGMDNLNDEPVAMHAAADAYPDRATHYGLPTMEEYSQPQTMGLDFGHGANNGVEYPPNAMYNPSQYPGYEGGYGTASGYSSNQDAAAYLEATRRSPSSPAAARPGRRTAATPGR